MRIGREAVVFEILVRHGPEPVVAVSGSVDLYSAGRLSGSLRREVLATRSASVAVDLTEVRFLSFEGLGALLAGHALAARNGKHLRLRGATGQPLELLELSGLGHLLLEDAAGRARP